MLMTTALRKLGAGCGMVAPWHPAAVLVTTIPISIRLEIIWSIHFMSVTISSFAPQDLASFKKRKTPPLSRGRHPDPTFSENTERIS
jgi:hypothetical protein